MAAGEAVAWPPDVIHAAWTEATPMRAFVVEFALRPEAGGIALLAADVAPGSDEDPREASRADGSLAPLPGPGVHRDADGSPDGEPW